MHYLFRFWFGCKIWIQSKACIGIFFCFFDSALHVFNLHKASASLDNARCKPWPQPSSFLQGIFWRNPKAPPVLAFEPWVDNPCIWASLFGKLKIAPKRIKKKKSRRETFHVHCDRKHDGFAQSSLSSFLFNFLSFNLFFSIWFFYVVFSGLEFVICFVWLTICYMWCWEIKLTLG